ncbi:MAG: hypothetical protein R3C68_14730 [Myxococcota bacterium]
MMCIIRVRPWADLMTMQEALGEVSGKQLVYVGDAGNNVAHSLLLAGPPQECMSV